ncbi:MAG: OmpH family outer membrane protein [Chloroflexi bacterium]|nr:OmpH family outer membrane protein [Chloroflexota bacterium]
MSKKIIWVVVLIIVIAIAGAAIFFGRDTIQGLFKYRSGISYIDVEKVNKAIMEMPEYEAAKKKMEAEIDSRKKEFEEKSKNLSEVDKQKLSMEMESELDRTLLKMKNDFMDRVHKTIMQIARKRKLNVVLDKGVVVSGVPDITDETLENLKNMKADTKVEEYMPKQSNIAYFDRSIIYSLKAVSDGQMQLRALENKMVEDFDKKSKSLTQQQKIELAQKYDAALQNASQRLQSEIEGAINEVVQKVAKEKNLDLVLEKQSVVFGGTNVTDEVIDSFNKMLNEGK